MASTVEAPAVNNNKSQAVEVNVAPSVNERHMGKKKAKRTTWTSSEEKQFLIICAENAITNQLDNCFTSAGNEEIYAAIQTTGLVEAGFPKKDVEKIRLKYRKMKTKFNDIREHNLRKTGRSRKEWVFYDLANTVWGDRPVACKEIYDTDELSTGENVNEDNSEEELLEEPIQVKSATKKNKKQKVDLGDTYFVDKLVELEEKKLQEQMKLERERMEHERKAKEDQLAFQREMLAMMHMQAERGMQHQQYPSLQQVQTGCSVIPHTYFPGGSFTETNKNSFT